MSMTDALSLTIINLCMAVSYTDPVISMDLLRTVLQPSFNDDILAVFKKYMKVSGHCVCIIMRENET